MNAKFNKWVARALVLTLVNPALFIQPAAAKDTAVYSGFLASTTTTVKPNILFLLDTSDSMNLPEAWREYEGAYDSHVEYLWNDLDRIVDADSNSTGEITAADDNKISTAAISGTFFTKWGFWYGATLAERQALWQAARTSAKATQSGDPGAAYLFRKYDDLSWVYWLPTGVAETDARLRSPSWNKFRGYIQELGNGQGGSQLRGGPTFVDTNNFQAYNQCGASLTALTPSTVFVPSSVAKNDGKYLNQQWARWEPYLATTAVGNSSYPGSSTQTAALGGATVYPKGYLDTTTASTGSPATNPVYRDSYPGTAPLGASGLPIRYNSGTAGAGWDAVKADAGGFILRSIIDGYATRADLEQVMSWYGLAATTDVDASGTVTIADTKFIAFKGNRDGTPTFGSATGVPAYYDVTATTCSSATGPASATCLDKPSGVTTPDFTLTKTATCKLSGGTTETDGSGNSRRRGSSCIINAISNSGTDTNGTSTYPSFSDVPAPTVCPTPTKSNQTIRSIDNNACSLTSTTVTAATTCAFGGATPLTINACAPSGGANVAVASCAWSGQSTDTVATCAWAGRQTKTVGTCAWSGRTAAYTEGVGWFASGGSCQESGSATYCSGTSGTTGPYATQAAALAATAGCSNAVAAASYQYGGTCTESGSATECAISGGTTVLGAGYTNVNAACNNAGAPAAGNYKYGGTCTENGSASSCQITGGTALNIRGNARTYNQACTNKANSGTTKNAVGSYAYNQTCTGSNNTCAPLGTASIIVRGTTYNQVTSCTSTLTAGTYYRGGSCSGTNVPCSQVTPYGGASVVSGGFTWYATRPTCTPPTAAQTYNSNCTGTQKAMPAIPPGGNAATSTTQAACNFTTSTVTINGTPYTNYVTCTNKSDTDTNCSTRYGVSCDTGCGAATPTSVTGGATSASHNYYRTYNFQDKTDYLVHDCKPDDSGTKFMHYVTGTLGSFGNPWSDTSSYAASSTGGVATDATKNVDMYSVNYLNWKFGPKGPNGHPIGRKTRLQIAKDVLSDVVSGFAKANAADVKLRVGLMAFNQLEKDIPSGATSGNSSGAHLVKAVKDLNTTHGNALIASVNALTASSATPLTESLFESYKYFKGDGPVFGGATYQAKEAANSTLANPRYVTEGIDTSTDALSGSNYKSPIIETCQANVVILVSDGAPENDTSADSAILALPASGDFSITQGTTSGQFETSPAVPFGPADTKGPPVGDNYVLLDELSYYMANVDVRSDLAGDQLVKLSTVSFGVDAPVLDKAAQTGGGNAYAASNAATLKDALEKAILAISQWQPQGNTPTITYNVSTGTSGDVYVAAFAPSQNVTWPGTIKKYRVGFGSTVCGDASCGNPNVCMTGNPAVTYGSCGNNVEFVDTDITLKDENGDAIQLRKIRSEAVSFWIPTSPADGGSGTKGGTGQVQIASGAPDTRSLYTFFTGTSTNTALSHVDNQISSTNAAISKSLLGNSGMSDAERNQLIGFAQGSDGLALSTWRTWAHFDSVHSVPLVEGQTVYYLTSDGVLHAVNTETGLERWAFMVEEGIPQIATVKANQVGDHLEVADGNPVLATTVDNKKLVIFGMRRGGRAYYALDVTNESSPLFAWKITPSKVCVGTSCSGSVSYAELGQAWSTPVVGYVRGYSDPGASATSAADDKLKPVIVFGGGYDDNQDSASAGADNMGRAVFVADAADGSLLKKFSTVIGSAGYSVPSDVLAIDTTGDAAGTLDRVYVGDMGGHLWRMDLDDRTGTNSPSNWTIVRLADLRTTARPIKLFNRPAMAPSIYLGQVFDAVFIGGGDTQQPTAIGTYDSGAFFMVKDLTVNGVAAQAASVPSAANSGDFVDMTDKTSATTLSEVTSASAPGSTRAQDLKAADGWVLNLSDGEKVTSQAQILSGYLFFGSYLPTQTPASSSATQCSLGGYGKQYIMDALTSTPLRDESGNLVNNNGNGRVNSFGLGFAGSGSLLGGGVGAGIFNGGFGKPATGITSTGVRVYWYSVPER